MAFSADSSNDQAADYLTDTGGPQEVQGLGQLLDEPRGHGGVVEIGGADLHGAGPGEEEFHHVVDGGDAADADDRDGDVLRDAPDQAQGQGLDRRAAEAA